MKNGDIGIKITSEVNNLLDLQQFIFKITSKYSRSNDVSRSSFKNHPFFFSVAYYGIIELIF